MSGVAVALPPQATVAAADVDAIEALFALPFPDLIFRAQQIHREHHSPNAVQLSTLLSVKTGGCPEDCGYCPQAKRYHTGVDDEKLVELSTVLAAARAAKAQGATRFCLGAACTISGICSCTPVSPIP